MRMRRMVHVLPTALVILAGAGGMVRADDGPAWHADGPTDGVQVEHRSVPGSSFDELRLSLTSTASVVRLCDAIYPKALPAKLERHFIRRDLLKQTDNDRWTYEQISVPVLSDRDYIVHTKRELDPSTGRCAVSFSTEVDPTRPPVPGFVRIPVIRGRWDIFPTEPGTVSVQYRIFSEPGGGVPAFLSRGGQRSTAIDFMKIILARAASPQ